jgi:hypothetical protein
MMRGIVLIENLGGVYLGMLYFIGSGLGIIKLLQYFNKRIKENANL